MVGQAPPQGPIPDLRSMEELLQAPTDGVRDAIVVPLVLANQFELKISLLNLVTAISFHGFENDDPHSHIQIFMKITQTVNLNQVPHDVIKLMLFPFSLEGAARTWLEKEPPNSIITWNDLVSKFVNRFFPPSKTTNLRNEVTRFQQRFAGETNLKLQVLVGARLKMPHIRSHKKLKALLSLHRLVNSVQNGCETCGGPHPYYECQAASGYTQDDVYATSGTYNQGGNVYQPQGVDFFEYYGPSIPPLFFTLRVEVEKEPRGLLWTRCMITIPASTPCPTPGFQQCHHQTKEDPKAQNIHTYVPEKLDDPGKFLIPCILQYLKVYNSLADSRASINLMPLSIFKKLGIKPLKPTRMTLELANRSVIFPMGIAEDVIVKVEKFNFLVDFVILDFEADPKVPIILGRPFLRTARALVDLYKEKLTLRVGNEEVVFYTDKSSRNNSTDIHFVHCINIIEFSKDKTISGNPTPFSNSMIESLSASPIPCGDKKSSGSTITHSDYSLPDYKAFYFDDNHIEEKSSGSTTTHSDFSLPGYDSFIFDLSINLFPPADRSAFYHEEFADELAHIISPSEYDYFYFDLEADPGEFTRVLKENIFDLSTKDFTSIELNNSPFLLYDCDSSLSEEFSEIDILVSFPFGNEDIVFDPRIITIKGVQSQRFKIPLNFFSTISFESDPLVLTGSPEIDTLTSFPS
ncbi:reverse transcriptase domain-containing protein [Tanacetum coccineum]